MKIDLGMPSDASNDQVLKEFALRWSEASIIYGDTGMHGENKTWPWGTQSLATSADGSCAYKVVAAMGWNSAINNNETL